MSDAMHGIYAQATEEANEMFNQVSDRSNAMFTQAAERFAEVVDGLKRMTAEMQHELEATRTELRKGILELPQETADSAAQMRRVIVDQIEALAELNRIVARHGRGLDAVEPAAPARRPGRCRRRRDARPAGERAARATSRAPATAGGPDRGRSRDRRRSPAARRHHRHERAGHTVPPRRRASRSAPAQQAGGGAPAGSPTCSRARRRTTSRRADAAARAQPPRRRRAAGAPHASSRSIRSRSTSPA